ncbi:MAG: DoxX family protein [Chitinophaga sp.]
MKPLFVLLIVFFIALIGTRLFRQDFDYRLSGKIALAAMLLFTSMGHFMFTKGMSMMLPGFVPFRVELVYLTGIIEIAAAIGIFIPGLRVITGILLIAFFVLILPANIYAAVKNLNYETGALNGNGIAYLWFRIPFQLLLMIWTYFFVVK